MATKFMPSRFMEQRGRCKKYPELFVECFKLSLITTDKIPHVVMQESAMSRLNDTCGYVQASADIDERPTQRQQPKKAAAKKASSKKKARLGISAADNDDNNGNHKHNGHRDDNH